MSTDLKQVNKLKKNHDELIIEMIRNLLNA